MKGDAFSDCVHCGFCLPACPTYVLWGREADSPRGRIVLMEALATGGTAARSVTRHVDLCIGCHACVTACPSGVRYDHLLETARQTLARAPGRGWARHLVQRTMLAVVPRRRWLRLATTMWRAAGRVGVIRWLERLPWPRPIAAAMTLRPPPVGSGPRVEGAGPTDGRLIGVLPGCVQDEFFPGVNDATIRALGAFGFRATRLSASGCCGALSQHAGRRDEARALARRVIDAAAEAGVEGIAANAAGCGAALREYGHWLVDDPDYAARAARFAESVRDLSEWLVSGEAPEWNPVDLCVAYQDPCHLVHGQRVREPPRELLRSIPGLRLIELPEADLCCGSGGLYNVLEPEAGAALGARKARHVTDTDAEALVTANPGCAMQLRVHLSQSARPMPVLDFAEVIDAATGGPGIPLS